MMGSPKSDLEDVTTEGYLIEESDINLIDVY